MRSAFTAVLFVGVTTLSVGCAAGGNMALCPEGCPAAQDCCAGTCVDLDDNTQNCGGCGLRCDPGLTCNNGTCSTSGCEGAQTNGNMCSNGTWLCGDRSACTGSTLCCVTAGNGACIDEQTDRRHCGGCGNVCQPGFLCDGGSCRADTSCAGGCDTGEYCDNGQCRCGNSSACPTSSSCVGNDPATRICADLMTDRNNCGQPGNVCNTASDCCAGSCVDVTSDANNCGECGRACAGLNPPNIPLVGQLCPGAVAGRADTCVNRVCQCGTNPICDGLRFCTGSLTNSCLSLLSAFPGGIGGLPVGSSCVGVGL